MESEEERAARLCSGLLPACFDQFLDGIVILDEHSVVRYANDSYLEYAGAERGQLVGKRLEPDWGNKGPEQPQYNIGKREGQSESYMDVLPIRENGVQLGTVVVVRGTRSLGDVFDRVREYETHIAQLGAKIREDYAARRTFEDVAGREQPCWESARRLAPADGTVLLLGERGTGKKLMAQYIHTLSTRRDGPFMELRCAGLTEQQLEGELFGYEVPGLAGGARMAGKMGLLEFAGGGTLLLDGILETPAPLKKRLLCAVREQSLQRVGGARSVPVSIRVIGTTNRDVPDREELERFSGELLGKFSVSVIRIPPLREHAPDIPDYVKKLLSGYSARTGVRYKVSREAKEALRRYKWPGNMKQLFGALDYITQAAPDGKIMLDTLPPYITGGLYAFLPHAYGSKHTMKAILEQVEQEVLREGVKLYGSDLSGRRRLAGRLGISLSTLYSKLSKHNLE